MIIADENIDRRLIEKLRSMNYEILSIKEEFKGIEDLKIIELTKAQKGVLLTEDNDFGEWVFAHNIKGFTVIFLRYGNREEYERVEENLINILKTVIPVNDDKFITITKNKIRTRII
ncbi:MAG: DUF5615 family PIN-like protein [Ignavibacteria bacterium]|nr:DUF5615 family PIN-like protein [Ignavibacteria bacterium]